MATLWAFHELVDAVKGRPFGASPSVVSGISIDSRTIQPGDVFFAIRGERFDGHDYVGAAIAKGAATAVVAEDKLSAMGRITGSLVVVRDVLDALGELGRAARARSRARIAAVTGSVGKTGTKDMLNRVLGTAGGVHTAPGSFNNHWGVPLTLARLPADIDYAVFEIGMNHAGEIAPLSAMVRPHAAIITTVEAAHLDAFPSVEAIAAAKAEIFVGLERGGTAVLNRDNPYFDLLTHLAHAAGVSRVIGFGEAADAAARLDDLVLDSDSSTVSARIMGRDVTYTLGAPGRHLVQNSLAVLACAAEFGVDLEQAAAALSAFTAPKGRGERARLSVGGGTVTLIDESYNANPASMLAAIALLAGTLPGEGGRRIAVLGDMLELGTAEMELHAALAEPLLQAGTDLVYLAGPRMAALWDALPADRRAAYAETATDLEVILSGDLAPGDVVMVKGSNGSRLGPVVEALKQRFAEGKRDGVASGRREQGI
jgi:UDP-N-acetylmuramoyl-tripeptide--D-alanyl-D-alanine ligase